MLMKIYDKLFNHFGRQNWWPTTSNQNPKFEIIVGAILTQQASWKNVERAINNLKNQNVLEPKKLFNLSEKKLEKLIRPSGFFKVKAKRLRSFLKFFIENYDGNLNKMSGISLERLREELLSVHGIGPETCDSILLYATEKPIFVVDAYTVRLCQRYPLINSKKYEDVQEFFKKNLPRDVNLFNEFHALIVELGKNYCKTKPICEKCPLKEGCKHAMGINNLSSQK